MEKVKKNINLEKDYWDKFYKDCAIDIPSQFCVSMATDNHNKKTVVEFGMGNGRDSLYLSTQGHIVVAVDISESAVLACNNTMQQKNIDHTTFLCGDISIKGTVANAISTARQNCHKEFTELIIYSRFVIHSLDQKQEDSFLTALSELIQSGDKVYFEFRSQQDFNTEKYYNNESHYRRYVDSEQFINNLREKYTLNIEYSITGKGMSKYKKEDPVVTRVIAVKP